MKESGRVKRAGVALMMALTMGSASSAWAGEAEVAKMEQARQAYDSGEWDRAVVLYEEVYKGSSKKESLHAEAALEWSNILWERGEYSKAMKHAEEALEVARALKLDEAVGRLLVTIGHIEASQGKLGSAAKTFALCSSLSKESGDEVFGAICRMNLSLVNRLRGRAGMSDAELKSNIALLESAKTPLAAGSAMAKTADLYSKNKNYAGAMALLQKAQVQFVAAGSVPAQARNRLRMAQVLQDSGDFDAARAQLELARSPLLKMNNRPALVNTYGLLGRDAQQRGQRADAVTHYNASLKLAQGIGNPQLIAQSHLALCEVLASPSAATNVEHHCVQATDRFSKLRVPELEARARIVRANLAQTRGENKEARAQYKEVIKLMEEEVSASVRDADTLAVQYANLCQVDYSLKTTGTLSVCKTGLEKLLALEKSGAYVGHIAATYYIAGFAAQDEKNVKQALRYFEQAALAYMKLPTPEPVRAADSQLRMGIIYSAIIKGEDNAERAFRKGLELLQGQERATGALAIQAQLSQQLVQLFAERKQWTSVRDEAQALIDRTKAHGSDPATLGWSYNYLAQAKLKTGDRAGAISALETGVEVLAGVSSQKSQRDMMAKSLKSLTK